MSFRVFLRHLKQQLTNFSQLISLLSMQEFSDKSFSSDGHVSTKQNRRKKLQLAKLIESLGESHDFGAKNDRFDFGQPPAIFHFRHSTFSKRLQTIQIPCQFTIRLSSVWTINQILILLLKVLILSILAWNLNFLSVKIKKIAIWSNFDGEKESRLHNSKVITNRICLHLIQSVNISRGSLIRFSWYIDNDRWIISHNMKKIVYCSTESKYIINSWVPLRKMK